MLVHKSPFQTLLSRISSNKVLSLFVYKKYLLSFVINCYYSDNKASTVWLNKKVRLLYLIITSLTLYVKIIFNFLTQLINKLFVFLLEFIVNKTIIQIDLKEHTKREQSKF